MARRLTVRLPTGPFRTPNEVLKTLSAPGGVPGGLPPELGVSKAQRGWFRTLLKLAKSSSRIGYFMSADEVKFRKPVFPGDTLFIHAELIRARGNKLAKAHCRCVVNETVVSEGDLMFTFLEQ